MAPIIDSDQHLYESRTLWRDHIDPKMRDDALRIEDDAVGTPWVCWRDQKIGVAEVQIPGQSSEIGERHREILAGQPTGVRYDEELPRDYWEPSARARQLEKLGLDEAVVFPNYGLLWERTLHASLPALHANLAAWNRWCATVVQDGGGRLHPSDTSPCATRCGWMRSSPRCHGPVCVLPWSHRR